MQRLLLFLFLLSLIVEGVAQDSLNRIDTRGLRQGRWIKTDPAGNRVYEGWFTDDQPDGTFRYFYPGGSLKTLSVYSQKGRKAETVSYFTDGRVMSRGNYIDQKKDSVWQFYSEITGSLVSEENYVNGRLEGPSKVYFPEGGIAEIKHFRDGIPEGKWEQFFTDGKIKLRGNYAGGEREGVFRAFYPEGSVKMSGRYIQGVPDGDWTHYSEKGVLLKTEVFRDGRLFETVLHDNK